MLKNGAEIMTPKTISLEYVIMSNTEKSNAELIEISKMINWDLVPDRFLFAVVTDFSIDFIVSQKFPTRSLFIVPRPRKLEDGEWYAFIYEGTQFVGIYNNEPAGSYFSLNNHDGLEIPESEAIVGQKLEKSLWDSQPKELPTSQLNAVYPVS
jgi:hypothetical protein